ncbi:MAG: energy transducer TonB, partial [Proteobacteria bacterium]|nr:energy transducer TonB [Pseudomonadota bacterium]
SPFPMHGVGRHGAQERGPDAPVGGAEDPDQQLDGAGKEPATWEPPPPPPEVPPETPPQEMDLIDPNAPTISIAAPTVNADTNIGGPVGMNIAEGDYLPIVRVAPVYPARALSRGLEGYVDMSFTVTETGTVIDAIVLFSTSSLFERAATRAVLKFKYKPRVVDGIPIAVVGVKTRISFQIED